MKDGFSPTIVCLFVVISLCAFVSARSADIEWKRSLKWSASDKREVVALAKLLGVEDPAIVDANLRDDCCRIATVTGRVVEKGPERRWNRALMIRESWREYAAAPRDQNALRVGHWIADGPTRAFAEWRVRDGAWFLDVSDGDHTGTTYRAAELIVLALRKGKVVNKIPETAFEGRRIQPSIPALKAGARYALSNEPALRDDRSTHQYEFSIDDKVLGLNIVGDIVEAVALFTVQF